MPHFDQLMAAVEQQLARVNPSVYPHPDLVRNHKWSEREVNIGSGSAYGGTRLSERVDYERVRQGLKRVWVTKSRALMVYAWEMGIDPAAVTDRGAWREEQVWSVGITPDLDPETVDAVLGLIEGTTSAQDARFDRYRSHE